MSKKFPKLLKTEAPTQLASKTNMQSKELIYSFQQLKEILEEYKNPVSCEY